MTLTEQRPANPWAEITYPLTEAETTRLSRLKDKVDATVHLGQVQLHVEPIEAKRLAFARWLRVTREISEWEVVG